MQDPLKIAKYYRDKADECLRRAARDGVEIGLRWRYRRLAECYSGFADAEERHAAKQSRRADSLRPGEVEADSAERAWGNQ